MSVDKTIRATLTSQHYPGDPDDAPHRIFQVTPVVPFAHISRLDRLCDREGDIVDAVAVHRSMTRSDEATPIEIEIEHDFFLDDDVDRPRAYDHLLIALCDEIRQLHCKRHAESVGSETTHT